MTEQTGLDQAFVTLNGVTKEFGDVRAVDSVSLHLQRGELVTLLGPSGCGKTTTLRMLAGFEEPTSGTILFQGRDMTRVPPSRRNVGFVFQNYALFPHLTVKENVAFGLRERRLDRAETRGRVERYLTLVGLEQYGERKPAQLSGGQQQRVALARALAIEPTVVLLDEPLAALDRQLRERMQLELRELLRGLETTAVFVTHDQDEALSMSDRIAVMNGGVVEQVAVPGEIYENPATRFCAMFLGLSNVFEGQLDAGMLTLRSGLRLPCALERQETWTTVMVRPERVQLRPADDEDHQGARARVRTMKYLGASTEYQLTLETGESLLAVVSGDQRPPVSESEELHVVVAADAWRSLAADPQNAAEAAEERGTDTRAGAVL